MRRNGRPVPSVAGVLFIPIFHIFERKMIWEDLYETLTILSGVDGREKSGPSSWMVLSCLNPENA